MGEVYTEGNWVVVDTEAAINADLKVDRGVSPHYVAGFLDGDGSISLAKRGSGEDWRRTPQVCFDNCDISILEKIADKFDGGRIGTKGKAAKKENHNVSYTLKYNGDSALKLMGTLLPYMHHKKKVERARLIVDNYKDLTPRNGKYTEEQKIRKTALVEAVMGIKMTGKGAY